MTRGATIAALVSLVGLAFFGIMFVLTNVGTIVDPPAPQPPIAGTSWESLVSLTAAQPVAVRVITVTVPPSARRAYPPNLDLGVRPDSADLIRQHGNDVWISIFDPDTGQGTPDPAGTGHATLDGWVGSGRDFDGCDREMCAARYAIVVRWLAPDAEQELDLVVFARISATLLANLTWGASPTLTPDPGADGMSIVEDVELAFDGAPSVLTAEASGAGHVSMATGPVEQHFELVVPAAVLGENVRYPLVGRALLRPTDARSNAGQAAAPWLHLTGPNGRKDGVASLAIDTDLLAGCATGGDCLVPITVALSLPEPRDYEMTPPPNAAVEASWLLTVRVEHFGSASMPSGELILREVSD